MRTTPLLAALLFFQELTGTGSGWMQIATGGVLSLLILKEVFAFIRTRNQSDGDLPSIVRGSVKLAVNESIGPVLDKVADNMSDLQKIMQRQLEILVEIAAIQKADRP